VLEVEDEDWEGKLLVFEVLAPDEVGDWAFLGTCLFNCRAFARAFSWVRTKYARF
jgi:hypothetical protein